MSITLADLTGGEAPAEQCLPEEKRQEALLSTLKQGFIVIWRHLNLYREYDYPPPYRYLDSG